jgi:hypothetical protein
MAKGQGYLCLPQVAKRIRDLTGLAEGYPWNHRRPCVNRVTFRGPAPCDQMTDPVRRSWPGGRLPGGRAARCDEDSLGYESDKAEVMTH